MSGKVFSDWLPSYIKAAQTVSEIFKIADYFLKTLCMSDIFGLTPHASKPIIK